MAPRQCAEPFVSYCYGIRHRACVNRSMTTSNLSFLSSYREILHHIALYCVFSQIACAEFRDNPCHGTPGIASRRHLHTPKSRYLSKQHCQAPDQILHLAQEPTDAYLPARQSWKVTPRTIAESNYLYCGSTRSSWTAISNCT
jgi:hypothetical protein